jgi:hypothetical protein
MDTSTSQSKDDEVASTTGGSGARKRDAGAAGIQLTAAWGAFVMTVSIAGMSKGIANDETNTVVHASERL